MDSLEGVEKYFKVNSKFDREPVEMLECRGNMVTGRGFSYDAGS